MRKGPDNFPINNQNNVPPPPPKENNPRLMSPIDAVMFCDKNPKERGSLVEFVTNLFIKKDKFLKSQNRNGFSLQSIEPSRLSKESLEIILTYNKKTRDTKSAFGVYYHANRIPVEALQAKADRKNKHTIGHKLLEQYQKNLKKYQKYEEHVIKRGNEGKQPKMKEVQKPNDLIDLFETQTYERMRGEISEDEAKEIQEGFAAFFKDALSIGLVTTEQFKNALYSGTISYEDAKQFASEKLLTPEMMDIDVPFYPVDEYGEYVVTGQDEQGYDIYKQENAKLYIYLISEDVKIVKANTPIEKWLDKNFSSLLKKGEKFHDKFIEESIKLEAKGVWFAEPLSKEELLSLIDTNNFNDIAQIFDYRIKRGVMNLDEQIDLMCDLLVKYHKLEKKGKFSELHPLIKVYESCQKAVFGEDFQQKEGFKNATENLNKLMEYCAKHPKATNLAVSKATTGFSKPKKIGQETQHAKEVEVLLAMFNRPLSKLSENFDKLKHIAPNQEQLQVHGFKKFGENVSSFFAGRSGSAALKHLEEKTGITAEEIRGDIQTLTKGVNRKQVDEFQQDIDKTQDTSKGTEQRR